MFCCRNLGVVGIRSQFTCLQYCVPLSHNNRLWSKPLRFATKPCPNQQHFVCAHNHSAVDTNSPTTASRGPASEREEKPGWHLEYQGPALDWPRTLWEPNSGHRTSQARHPNR